MIDTSQKFQAVAQGVWIYCLRQGKRIAGVLKEKEALGVLTPYAYHHVIEALLHVGEKEKALELMRTYWGGMIELGADTFWEAFDQENPLASPYGNMQVNSFCHAWSCTPAWILRKYFVAENRNCDR